MIDLQLTLDAWRQAADRCRTAIDAREYRDLLGGLAEGRQRYSSLQLWIVGGQALSTDQRRLLAEAVAAWQEVARLLREWQGMIVTQRDTLRRQRHRQRQVRGAYGNASAVGSNIHLHSS